MYLDRITDAIAHFAGLFELTTEQARARESYDEFVATHRAAPDAAPMVDVKVHFQSPYTLEDYVPGIAYAPIPPTIDTVVPFFNGRIGPLPMPGASQGAVQHAAEPLISHHLVGSATLAITAQPEPDLPGSVILSAHQQANLLDDDHVSIGGGDVVFQPLRDYASDLQALVHEARLDTPFGHDDPPGSTGAIKEAIVSTDGVANSLLTQFDGSGVPYYLTQQPTLSGITVDGESRTDFPQLKDYLPQQHDPADPAEPSTSLSVTVEHGPGEPGSLTLDAGGNTLVNSASLANGGLTAPTFAILGDHFETNTIIQINAWSDHDLVGNVFGAPSGPGTATQGVNAAAFERIDPAAGSPAAGQPMAFPTHWQVDTIDGDMVFMSWINQYNFVSDNDTHVYASTGATTTVTTGANTSINQISFTDIGHYYDLIVIGGSCFEANFIQQTNVLLDDDFVTGVGGFRTSGTAGLSTDGNVLWNSASITNVGASDRFDAMPDYFRKACADLASGKTDMPQGLGNDPAFAGLNGLHVLYVSGDVLELQTINQTNILGDADQVALVRQDFAKDWHGPEATVSTGSNTLVNQASITDLDTTGKVTYVGGDHYSDEILFQAELVKPASETLGHQDTAAVAYEAIAFMGEHAPDQIQPDIQPPASHHIGDAVSHDVMHTMLA